MTNSIGGLQIRTTKNVITPDTKICMLLYAPNKFGKTTMMASLDTMLQKFFGTRLLDIACEPGEGGGTMSIQEMDVPFVVPQNLNDIEKIIAELGTSTQFGGVAMDSSSEMVKRFLLPYALKFPSRERTPTRDAGVPERSDYQTMGEKAREIFNKLINLTCHPDPKLRKHLLVTACEKEKTDDRGNVLQIQPDLPGAMAGAATAMFQTVAGIAIRTSVENNPSNPTQKIRVSRRVLLTHADGVRIVGDRTKVFPAEGPLDFVELWEKHWLPRIADIQAKA